MMIGNRDDARWNRGGLLSSNGVRLADRMGGSVFCNARTPAIFRLG